MAVEDLHVLPRRGDVRDLARLGAQPHGDEEPHGGQRLGHADADDGEDEAGRPGEAADDDEVDEAPDEGAPDDGQRKHCEVGHAVLHIEQEAGDGGHRADGGGREVDDAVGAVDEDQAHGDHAVERTEGHAFAQLGDGERKEEADDDQEEHAGGRHPRRLGAPSRSLPELPGALDEGVPRPRPGGRVGAA